MVKKICFTGSQGTGKTTMRNELVKYFNEHEVNTISNYVGVEDSISRDAKSVGFKINEETDFNSQYYMSSKYISADLLTDLVAERDLAEYIILDRSVIDVLPYTALAKDIGIEQYRFIARLLEDHFHAFVPNILFYCRPLPEVNSDNDPLRSANKKFQEDIDKLFFAFAQSFVDQGVNVVKLESDTLENRMKIIYEEIGKLD